MITNKQKILIVGLSTMSIDTKQRLIDKIANDMHIDTSQIELEDADNIDAFRQHVHIIEPKPVLNDMIHVTQVNNRRTKRAKAREEAKRLAILNKQRKQHGKSNKRNNV